MTEDDQDVAIGRLVATYSETKKRRAALMSEAWAIRGKLDAAARALGGLDNVKDFSDGRATGHALTRPAPTFHHDYPDPQRVRDLLAELATVAGDVRELRGRLKDAGLDVE